MNISDNLTLSEAEKPSPTPRITVLMPVFNAEHYLTEALNSILAQTYRYFRLLIIDDASTDSSRDIIEAVNDFRIETIRLEKSGGVARALNLALDLADTEFIARMDADDLAAPDRFDQQLTFLDENQDVGVCGSSIEMLRGRSRCVVSYPETHDEILGSLAIFKRSICHPSVMIRVSALEGARYCESYAHSEDLHMWHSLIRHTRFHNIQKPLLAYRLHDGQVSARYKSAQIDGTRKMLAETLPKYFPSVEDNVRMSLLELLVPDRCREIRTNNSLSLRQLYARLVSSNDRERIVPGALFEDIILSKFFEETCKQYLGFWNTAYIWLRALQRQPALFIEGYRRLRFHWPSLFFRRRGQ